MRAFILCVEYHNKLMQEVNEVYPVSSGLPGPDSRACAAALGRLCVVDRGRLSLY